MGSLQAEGAAGKTLCKRKHGTFMPWEAGCLRGTSKQGRGSVAGGGLCRGQNTLSSVGCERVCSLS